MIVCVHYSVCRGNSLENNEWIHEELRGLPTRVRPLAQDYDPDRSAGWLLMPNLEQAVWLVQEYGADRRTSYLCPRGVPVSTAAELPSDLERLMGWLEDLAFARTVLDARPDDPYYLVYPDGRLEGAIDVGLLARYARRGNARLLPASQSTDWDEADRTWERLLVPARISRDETSLGRVPEDTKDLAALRRLVERIRAEAPRQIDLIFEKAARSQAEHLAHLLVLTQSLVARVVAA